MPRSMTASHVFLLCLLLFALSSVGLAGQRTLVLQQGLGGYTGAADAYVRKDDWGRPVQYTRNYGRSERLKISYHADESPLLRFDLGDLPAGATIVTATLSLYNVTQSEGTRTIRLHRVLRDWHAGNQDNAVIDAPGAYGVTGLKAFDYYPGEGEDVLWHAIGMQPGSDLAATAESATPVGGVGWYDWDVTTLVRAWTDGAPNYGVTLRDPDDWEPRNARRAFLSSDYADDPSLRPKLIIVYEPRVGGQGGQGGAAFPAEHYPTGAHPRLWLTAERLAAFEQARRLDTPQWEAFKQTCDHLIDDDPNNDIWNLDRQPQGGTAPLALMYRLTGDARYAERALELMDAVRDDQVPDHANYHYLALAYDWLYDYPGMSEQRKRAYRQKMINISDGYWNGYNGGGTHTSNGDSDLNLETGMVHLVLGAAIFGEDERALDLLERGWQGWTQGYGGYGTTPPRLSNSDYLRRSLGGVYPTGHSYFPGVESVGISGYWMTLATACHYDVTAEHPELTPFWGNAIRSLIHLTDPLRASIYHTGSWQDPNVLSQQHWLYQLLAFATYFSERAGQSDIAALGRGYAAGVDLGYHTGWFTEFFFDTPGDPANDPYQAELPRIRFADEPDFLLFRSDWGENATWGMFTGDGSLPVDHQPPDHGHFVLWRGGEYLTKGARNYDAVGHGEFFNGLSIENGCHVAGRDCSGTAVRNPEAPASISRHHIQLTEPRFAYAMLEADGQWNDDPEEWHASMRVETYRRHFFWSGDYVVVFDRLRTRDAGTTRYRLRAMTPPSVEGATVTQYSGSGLQKLLHRTLEPEGSTPRVVDESVAWADVPDWKVHPSERRWQTVIDLPVSDRINMLNVMQMGPASMTGFDPLEHIQTGTWSGVRIGDWVVLFSAEEQLASTASYRVADAPAGLHHLVADLVPGSYRVRVNGIDLPPVTVSDGDNSAHFTTESNGPVLSVELTRQ